MAKKTTKKKTAKNKPLTKRSKASLVQKTRTFSRKKVSKSKNKAVRKSSSKTRAKQKGKMSQAGWFFVNLLIFVLFLYSLWLIWSVSWSQGLSLIVALLIIIFVIKFVKKIKKK